MKTRIAIISAASLTILLLVQSGLALANTDLELIEAPEDLDKIKSCIGTRSIKKTKILNERVIVFYARGNKIYQNLLPRKCSGLNKDSIISYRLTTNRLCQHDQITILRDHGRTLSPGISCGLGKFEEVPSLDALKGLVEDD